ncbi:MULTISPECIES: endo alpha-1,4 polygalactosaminidase [Kitasatospora]|uniref:Endo alpha-1,4 polygalactosaminidase n=1 Tax=Kitasatospora cathayae TaxID=3004092 RepID=A0ABY7QGG0_9ACTN|nr:endo alpha-1,4 polygalactosaminidase [Kitasatospora sp. HUAS 3-15]WBP91847.1 endo alpha-1,4 polygalactosaminidase [Kitasatospora sp. HUAS 3-15]
MSRVLSRRSVVALTASTVIASFLTTACSGGGSSEEAPSSSQGTPAATGAPSGEPGGRPSQVTLPPVHAGIDYQLGGPSTPAPGVTVLARDHTAPPAQGSYNICYLNGFQAQPGAEKEWEADLLLRDQAGKVVMDKEWGEAMLDIHTEAKRKRIGQKLNTWIDECAAKGYQAVEADNYDTYTRAPDGLLTADDAKAFLSLLAAHAHEKGLAVGQKNTPELAPARKEVGADFAVAEECGQYNECGDYTAAFGDHVIVIEYTDSGMKTACRGWGDRISIVRRDKKLVPAGSVGHLRQTCGTS